MRKLFRAPLLAGLVVLLLPSCIHYRDVLRRPQIDDGLEYGRIPLPEPETEAYRFAERTAPVELPVLEAWADPKAQRRFDSVEAFLKESKTTALLVIRNDSILFETYPNGYGPGDITQVFSVTKPLTVSLMAVALEEGLIETVHEPVSRFVPLRRKNARTEQLTLNHLANMQSGINHNDYLRIFRIIRFYHARNADRMVDKAQVRRTPGKRFRYKSIDTQVLGNCLEEVFGEEDLIDRFIELYWKNIGPEHPGYYSIDDPESGNPKYYGGLNISARDLAKIGKIYLEDGTFDGKRILPQSWMDYLADTANHVGKVNYCMGWYFDEYAPDRRVFYGAGFNGQYLVINRDTNTIIVRLGESKSGYNWYGSLSELSTLF